MGKDTATIGKHGYHENRQSLISCSIPSLFFFFAFGNKKYVTKGHLNKNKNRTSTCLKSISKSFYPTSLLYKRTREKKSLFSSIFLFYSHISFKWSSFCFIYFFQRYRIELYIMSHGPPRTFQSQAYSTLQTNPIPRQQAIAGQQVFQHALVTTGPSATINQLGQNNNNSTNGTTSNNGSPSSISNTGSKATNAKIYCDSCQTFRHSNFFNDTEFKYNVCNICHNREMQKRKHQLERYEIYEEQRSYKQARFTSPQQSHLQYTQQQITAPINMNNNNSSNANSNSGGGGNSGGSTHTSSLTPPQTIPSPQIKQSPPASSILLPQQQINSNNNGNTNNTNNGNMFTNASMRNPSQLQSHLQAQQAMQSAISLPLPNHTSTEKDQNNTKTMPLNLPSTNVISPNALATPQPTHSTSSPTTTIIHHRANSSSAVEKASLDVIDFPTFVRELEKETVFDRKQYHLDIIPLMDSMGENAGFTQLGRGICERVLEGTKFNFR